MGMICHILLSTSSAKQKELKHRLGTELDLFLWKPMLLNDERHIVRLHNWGIWIWTVVRASSRAMHSSSMRTSRRPPTDLKMTLQIPSKIPSKAWLASGRCSHQVHGWKYAAGPGVQQGDPPSLAMASPQTGTKTARSQCLIIKLSATMSPYVMNYGTMVNGEHIYHSL